MTHHQQYPHQPPHYQPPQPPPAAKRRRWPWIVGGITVFVIVVAAIENAGPPDPVAAPPAGSVAPLPPGTPIGTVDPGFLQQLPTSSSSGPSTGAYGDALEAGGLTLTVSEPREVTQQYLGSQVCSTVTYRNTGDTSESFNPFDWRFRTSDGVEASAGIPYGADRALRSGQLSPGGRVQGQVCSDDSITDASAVVYSPGFGILHQLVWEE